MAGIFHQSRGGVRGGQDQFKWDDVRTDKDRENYLGHSVMVPVGKWQEGKDLIWYTRGKKSAADERAAAEERKREEIRKVKEIEARAMAAALGHKSFSVGKTSLTVQEMQEVLSRGKTEHNDGERIQGMGYKAVSREQKKEKYGTEFEGTDVQQEEDEKKTSKSSKKKRKKEKKSKKKKRKRENNSDDESPDEKHNFSHKQSSRSFESSDRRGINESNSRRRGGNDDQRHRYDETNDRYHRTDSAGIGNRRDSNSLTRKEYEKTHRQSSSHDKIYDDRKIHSYDKRRNVDDVEDERYRNEKKEKREYSSNSMKYDSSRYKKSSSGRDRHSDVGRDRHSDVRKSESSSKREFKRRKRYSSSDDSDR